MGFSTSAYVAYGVHVPVNPYHRDSNGRSAGEQVDQALQVPTVKAACPDVGHLEAGDYDRDSFFVTTAFHEAGYEATWLTELSCGEESGWDQQIMRLLEVMGWSGLVDEYRPGWFIIADTS